MTRISIVGVWFTFKVDLNALQEFIDPKFQPPIAFASGAYTTKEKDPRTGIFL